MAKKKTFPNPICGECMKPIDYSEVLLHRLAGTEYRHEPCGRILVRQRG